MSIPAPISSITKLIYDKALVLLLCSIITITMLVDDLFKLLPLFTFVCLSYLLIISVAKQNKSPLYIYLIAIVFIFIWLKKYTIASFLPPLADEYTVIGLSYAFFKILHIIIDVKQGAIVAPRFKNYLCYIFYFPSFLSGPIQTYNDFSTQVSCRGYMHSLENINIIANRLIFGVFLAIVAASLTKKLHLHIMDYGYYVQKSGNLPTFSIILALAAIVYTLYIYINFTGYMIIAIEFSKLLGIKLPDNFNRPYLAENFLQIWSRWHITLSEWFKTYVFNSILLYYGKRVDKQYMSYISVIGFLLTFIAMGVWHGTTVVFILYGVFLGVGASVNKFWQIKIVRIINKKEYRTLCDNLLYVSLCRGLALSYFCMSIICIWIDPSLLNLFLSAYGIIVIVTSYIASTALIFLISIIASSNRIAKLVAPKYAAINSFFLRYMESKWTGAFVTAFNILILLHIAALFSGSQSEFVYMAF